MMSNDKTMRCLASAEKVYYDVLQEVVKEKPMEPLAKCVSDAMTFLELMAVKDYELLAKIPPADLDRMVVEYKRVNAELSEIMLKAEESGP